MFRTLTVFWLAMALVIQGPGGKADAIASRQFEEAPDHPLVGSWMLRQAPENADDPWIPAPAEFRADGTVMLMVPVRQASDGTLLSSTMALGTWRPTGPREGQFTAMYATFDASGRFHGTVRVEGLLAVSASGQTFVETGESSAITETNAAGFVEPGTGQPEASPMMATRIVLDAGGHRSPCGPLLPFCE